MKYAIIICTVILLMGCDFKRQDVLKYYWKYQRGEHLGDVLAFDNENYRLDENFDVYKKDKKIGKIIKCSEKQLIVLTMNNKEGYYVPATYSKEYKQE